MASGQESVVLVAEVKKLGHCLNRKMKFFLLLPEKSFEWLLPACTLTTGKCNEPLERGQETKN